MSKNSLPKFDAPPVIETVLSAQFSSLPNFTNAHEGIFWKNYLDSSWDKINAGVRIQDVVEPFDDDNRWNIQEKFKIHTTPPVERLQIIRSATKRMIQIQDTRFVYNWLKQDDSTYPSYNKILPEFKTNFEKYEKFANEIFETSLAINQWEITYINHIPKGELWNTPSDWSELFPKMAITPNNDELSIYNIQTLWVYTLKGNKGRLYIELKHARVGGTDGPEILLLQFVARGAAKDTKSLIEGFDIGHAAIVNTFAEITSKKCHDFWKRSA